LEVYKGGATEKQEPKSSEDDVLEFDLDEEEAI
jgi:hypothetical protein